MATDKKYIALSEKLTEQQMALVRAAGAAAQKLGNSAYIVGGSVRDMLLGRAVKDLDIVCSANIKQTADLLIKNHGCKLLRASRFDTFMMKYEDLVFDLVQARGETYPKDGELPKVQRGGLMDDLQRRDFSVNAMAVSISEPDFGLLKDPFGGMDDLHSQTLRTMHSASFANDPTRMVRAVRYGTRLGFKLAEGTLSELRANLAAINTISPARLTNELVKVLAEPRRADMLLQMAEVGLTGAILDALAASTAPLRSLRELDERGESRPPDADLGFAYWVAELDTAAVAKLSARLQLSRVWASILESQAEFGGVKAQLSAPELPPSAVTKLLRDCDPLCLTAQADVTADEAARERINAFLTNYRSVSPQLNGADLVKLGFKRDKNIARCLQQITDALLDGELKTRADEVKFAEAFLRNL